MGETMIAKYFLGEIPNSYYTDECTVWLEARIWNFALIWAIYAQSIFLTPQNLEVVNCRT